jgi:hypothetical protein
MSSERPEEFSQAPANRGQPTLDDGQDTYTAGNQGYTAGNQGYTAGNQGRVETAARHQATGSDSGSDSGGSVRDQKAPAPSTSSSPPSKQSSPKDVTVLVRGETVGAQEPKSSTRSLPKDKEKALPKPLSEAKIKMQSRLPALADDGDVGIQKDHVVTRDGKADLAFTGTLLASAAPPSAPKGGWQEYRIYETNGGKYVFSKVSRHIVAEEQDGHEVEVFEPSPSSTSSQLLRSARDLVHSQPLTWKNAAVDFFGYDPLAKALYRKFGDEFEERIG